jgi:dipeptidyl aminopeptidase/acylaminoacyl peptidase
VRPGPGDRDERRLGTLIARDPARHLRHPSVSPDRRFVVAAAYAPPAGTDLAIDHPGAIALFDARTGAVVRELTAGRIDSGPVFSPDGRFVAFERSGSIWRVPVAGGRATRLVRGARQPARGR